MRDSISRRVRAIAVILIAIMIISSVFYVLFYNPITQEQAIEVGYHIVLLETVNIFLKACILGATLLTLWIIAFIVRRIAYVVFSIKIFIENGERIRYYRWYNFHGENFTLVNLFEIIVYGIDSLIDWVQIKYHQITDEEE